MAKRRIIKTGQEVFSTTFLETLPNDNKPLIPLSLDIEKK